MDAGGCRTLEEALSRLLAASLLFLTFSHARASGGTLARFSFFKMSSGVLRVRSADAETEGRRKGDGGEVTVAARAGVTVSSPMHYCVGRPPASSR